MSLKGSISFVNRSDSGHRGGIWEASVYFNGRRFRKRSAKREKCEEWLTEMNLHAERPPRRPFRVVEEGDPRLKVRYGNHSLTMEQRENYLRRLVCEAQLTLEYWRTRDLTAIVRHVDKVVFPELIMYFQNDRGLLGISLRDREQVVYNALAVFYTLLYSDTPVYDYTRFIKKLIRLYVTHGDFWDYDVIPEPVHRIVESVDYSILQTKYIVKKAK